MKTKRPAPGHGEYGISDQLMKIAERSGVSPRTLAALVPLTDSGDQLGAMVRQMRESGSRAEFRVTATPDELAALDVFGAVADIPLTPASREDIVRAHGQPRPASTPVVDRCNRIAHIGGLVRFVRDSDPDTSALTDTALGVAMPELDFSFLAVDGDRPGRDYPVGTTVYARNVADAGAARDAIVFGLRRAQREVVERIEGVGTIFNSPDVPTTTGTPTVASLRAAVAVLSDAGNSVTEDDPFDAVADAAFWNAVAADAEASGVSVAEATLGLVRPVLSPYATADEAVLGRLGSLTISFIEPELLEVSNSHEGNRLTQELFIRLLIRVDSEVTSPSGLVRIQPA